MNRLIHAFAATSLTALAAAAIAETPPAIEFLNSGKVTPTTLPFSEAVRVGDTLYLSGQIGIKPGTLELLAGGIREQSRQTLDHLVGTFAAL